MDAGEISGSVSADRAAGEGRPMGDYRRNVGRTGFEYAGRRITGATDSRGQALFPEEFRRGREDRLESRFVRIRVPASSDLQKVRHGLLRDPEVALGARIHDVSLQAILVAGTRWQPPSDIFSP